MNAHRVMAATKRVALAGIGAVAFVIVMWVAAATVGIVAAALRGKPDAVTPTTIRLGSVSVSTPR